MVQLPSSLSSSFDSVISTESVCSAICRLVNVLTIPQSESMVEIKRALHTDAVDQESERCRLLYSKSKVYVHPTAYARDNIPGFVALVERVSAHQLPLIEAMRLSRA